MATVCRAASLPETVLMISSVNVEGSEEPGIQVTLKEEVRSTVLPANGEVNVRASDVVANARTKVKGSIFFDVAW